MHDDLFKLVRTNTQRLLAVLPMKDISHHLLQTVFQGRVFLCWEFGTTILGFHLSHYAVNLNAIVE